MHISEFDYELPEELIAQHPLGRRDASRMLVASRAEGSWRDGSFSEFPAELREGDCVVVNNTRVFPARLEGRREPTGGRVEFLLVRRREDLGGETWEAMARPARRLDAGARVTFGDGRLSAEVLSSTDDGARRVVRFETSDTGGDFAAMLEEFGRMPLPPYIKRDGQDLVSRDEDRERYQTVYAASSGAIAAPTAGLHFTPEVFERLRARGVGIAELTLHVGYGTFAPVRAEDLSTHSVAPESFEISEEAADTLNDARSRGGRLVAVGTTTVRALESSADEGGRISAGRGETGLTITPGYNFRAVGAMLTNFHLPRSSLLVLVSAFAGREFVLSAYRHAVAARYRFYSYGDCMLII
ncbi:MAG TPA: tRNA preQ1(34) S-adenosylmethionine ribosyltransferase-isomerase QueA [Pyrinomonadaceae bacterium]|jgi:S-adenosylmethionine:tRNA ribosyltransferase-isomerase|nr:tRNA preQ1(34) S-adenosylmethionine ribosyltransferase-isomerase QueA [Pyrinomonadaceae bacterium]